MDITMAFCAGFSRRALEFNNFIGYFEFLHNKIGLNIIYNDSIESYS